MLNLGYLVNNSLIPIPELNPLVNLMAAAFLCSYGRTCPAIPSSNFKYSGKNSWCKETHVQWRCLIFIIRGVRKVSFTMVLWCEIRKHCSLLPYYLERANSKQFSVFGNVTSIVVIWPFCTPWRNITTSLKIAGLLLSRAADTF